MSRNTSMRSSGRRRYIMSEHGNSDVNARHGNHLLVPGAANLWQPAYDAGPTTIRILPGLNPNYTNDVVADPNTSYFDPYRFPSTNLEDPNGFGDFIRRYSAVRSMGDPSTTFIYHDPADDEAGDKEMTPPWILYRAIDRAVASGNERPGWGALLRGGQGRGAQLSRPSEIYLVQCMVMLHKGNVYPTPKGFAADEQTVVMELGRSAGSALVAELAKEVDGYVGNPDDFQARYVNGDPVSLDQGRYVTFYTLKQGDPRTQSASPQAASGWSASAGTAPIVDSQGRPLLGYGCFMEETFNGGLPVLTDFENNVRSKVRSWDDIINIPTVEKQAQLLADKFPPDVIEYAWRDTHPEWIPEEVRARAVAAVSVQVPGMPQYAPQQATPPMPAAPVQQPVQQPMAYPGHPSPPPSALAQPVPNYPAPLASASAPAPPTFGVPASAPAAQPPAAVTPFGAPPAAAPTTAVVQPTSAPTPAPAAASPFGVPPQAAAPAPAAAVEAAPFGADPATPAPPAPPAQPDMAWAGDNNPVADGLPAGNMPAQSPAAQPGVTPAEELPQVPAGYDTPPVGNAAATQPAVVPGAEAAARMAAAQAAAAESAAANGNGN